MLIMMQQTTDLHVAFDDGDGVCGRLRADLADRDFVDFVVVVDCNGVALGQACKRPQRILQHCARVADVEKVRRLRLEPRVLRLGFDF